MKEGLFAQNEINAPAKTVPLFTLKGLGEKVKAHQIASQTALETFGNDMKERVAQIPAALNSEEVRKFNNVAIPLITTAMMSRGLFSPASAGTVRSVVAQRARLMPAAAASGRYVAARAAPRAIGFGSRAMAFA